MHTVYVTHLTKTGNGTLIVTSLPSGHSSMAESAIPQGVLD